MEMLALVDLVGDKMFNRNFELFSAVYSMSDMKQSYDERSKAMKKVVDYLFFKLNMIWSCTMFDESHDPIQRHKISRHNGNISKLYKNGIPESNSELFKATEVVKEAFDFVMINYVQRELKVFRKHYNEDCVLNLTMLGYFNYIQRLKDDSLKTLLVQNRTAPFFWCRSLLRFALDIGLDEYKNEALEYLENLEAKTKCSWEEQPLVWDRVSGYIPFLERVFNSVLETMEVTHDEKMIELHASNLVG